MAARFTVLSGPFSGRVVEITGPKLLIGREEDCDVRPDSRLVSRHHCVFLQDGYTLRLRDLGSRNGTYVNGSRISHSVSLSDGDTVSIGEMTLKIEVTDQAGGAHASNGKSQKSGLAQTDVFDGETLRGQADITRVPATRPSASETVSPD